MVQAPERIFSSEQVRPPYLLLKYMLHFRRNSHFSWKSHKFMTLSENPTTLPFAEWGKLRAPAIQQLKFKFRKELQESTKSKLNYIELTAGNAAG